jgi:hypothetical protein
MRIAQEVDPSSVPVIPVIPVPKKKWNLFQADMRTVEGQLLWLSWARVVVLISYVVASVLCGLVTYLSQVRVCVCVCVCVCMCVLVCVSVC